jgi:ATP/maltotriose-dependent transcriptional regulator MalT
MRVLLVGSPRDRVRLRAQLDTVDVEIAAEFSTLAAARASDVEHDAIIIADSDARPELVEGGALRDQRPSSDDETLWEPLTSREVQVLELLAEGLPNKAIAARLNISDQTVKFHVSAICGKLGAANRTDAVRRAVRRGLITL